MTTPSPILNPPSSRPPRQRHCPSSLPTACCLLPTPRSGFTFTEVMFAVILLGIGFIMLAGMFPVAIQQTASNMEETLGTQIAQSAVRNIAQVATAENLRPTGDFTTVPPMVLSFRQVFDPGVDPHYYQRSINTAFTTAPEDRWQDLLYNPVWTYLRGDLIHQQDPRLAYVPMYLRVPGQNVAQIIVIAVQSRNADVFTPANAHLAFDTGLNDPVTTTTPYVALEPRRLEAILSDGGPDVDLIEIRTPRAPRVPGANPLDCVEAGAFVVIAQDRIPTGNAYIGPGRATGRIYRIGQRRDDLTPPNMSGSRVFELIPGYDLATRAENLPPPTAAQNLWVNNDYGDHDGNLPAVVYVVGRGQQDPLDEDSPYTGPVQDVAAYTTFINLK